MRRFNEHLAVIVCGIGMSIGALAACGDDADTALRDESAPSLPASEVPLRRPALAATKNVVVAVGDATIERAAVGEWGDVLPGDALVFTPRTGLVTKLALPFDDPLLVPVALGTEHGDVLVVGTACARAADMDGAEYECEPGDLAAATYNVESGRWRPIAMPRSSLRSTPYAAAVGVDGDRIVFASGRDYFVYDVRAGTLDKIAQAGTGSSPACVAAGRIVTGGPVTIVGGRVEPNDPLEAKTTPAHDRAQYARSIVARPVSGEGTWREVHRVPLTEMQQHESVDVHCLEDEVIVAGPTWSEASMVDIVTAQSRRVEPADVLRADLVTWTGNELLAFDYEKVRVFEPRTAQWSAVRRLDSAPYAVVPVGNDVVAAMPVDTKGGGATLRVLPHASIGVK